MSQSKQTVCLNMIVRNECRIIERCLNSVRGFIDHWMIVDTGSTDGTQQFIRECLRDIPGELIERPWVDFAHNRSEALEFARGKSDYVLVIDADEVLVKNDDYAQPQLTHDAYYLRVRFGQLAFWRVHLFRNEPGWRYESPVHEYLAGPLTATYDKLNGVAIDSFQDGWRAAQPDVNRRDIEILLREHEQAPDNARTTFYLAQSYLAAKELELALKYYQHCVATTNWSEERWTALLQVADLKQQLQLDWPEVLAAYLEAYQFRPQRAEPLYRIALYYRWQGAFHLAHLFLQQAVAIPYPREEYMFVEERLYRYLIKMALATCCYHIGQYEAGLRYCDELLETPQSMPSNIYEQVLLNRQQCASKLADSNTTSEDLPKVKVFVGLHSFEQHLDNCEADDIVLFLNGSSWLISEEALVQLQKCFRDPTCLVTYGQFQYADGAAGLASWIPDINSERLLTDDWRCTYPLAVRGRLLKQVASEGVTPEDHVALARKLFAAAGSDGVRFNAYPICVYDAENNASRSKFALGHSQNRPR